MLLNQSELNVQTQNVMYRRANLEKSGADPGDGSIAGALIFC